MNIKLPEAVAKEFELVDWVGGHRQHFGKHGIVDLEKLSLIRAKSLVKGGFKKLRKKEKSTTKAIAPKEQK